MTLRAALEDLARTIADQAERDPAFAEAVSVALAKVADQDFAGRATDGKSVRQRPQPALNPVQTARQGEETLRSGLDGLSVDELKAIVSAYALDPKRLAMRWKSPQRLADLIVTASMARARKGDAFREQ